MSDDRQKVLDATDIADLVGEHLSLKQRGAEFVGLCPFHDDHKPSMAVVPRKGIFYCFSCGAGGNAIDFMMKYHGMGFREALQSLAERAGIELTPSRPQHAKQSRAENELQRLAEGFSEEAGASRDELARANAFAQSLFRGLLNHPEHGQRARHIIAHRKIPDHTAEAFGLGASPDRWDGLIKTAESKRFPLPLLEAAGLLKRRQNADGLYDTFRNRLMFPIQDQMGRVIAFGARKIDEEDEPKYLNSPESALFDKSSTLYALSQATRAIKQHNLAIVTEGYMDAIACHAAGVENVVATLGTAMTLKHAKLLRRLCDRVVLLFDGDEAGQRAADRAVEVLLAEPIDVQVAVLPEGQDPDDLLQAAGGHEAFMAVIAAGEDALKFRHQRLEHKLTQIGAGPGSAARVRLVEEDVQRLVELGLDRLSPIRRQAIVKRLAAIAKVDERAILEAIGRSRATNRNRREPDTPETTTIAPRTPVDHALACLLAHPNLIRDATGDAGIVVDAAAMPANTTERRALAGALAELLEDADQADETAIQTAIATLDDDTRQYATGLMALGSSAVPEAGLLGHWQACILECRRWIDHHHTQEPHSPHPTSAAEPPEPGDQAASNALLARIARIRALGGNPRNLPKPPTNSG